MNVFFPSERPVKRTAMRNIIEISQASRFAENALFNNCAAIIWGLPRISRISSEGKEKCDSENEKE